MPLIMKDIAGLNLAWQWRYLTDKTGFLFIGTHCISSELKPGHYAAAAAGDALTSARHNYCTAALTMIRQANSSLYVNDNDNAKVLVFIKEIDS